MYMFNAFNVTLIRIQLKYLQYDYNNGIITIKI